MKTKLVKLAVLPTRSLPRLPESVVLEFATLQVRLARIALRDCALVLQGMHDRDCVTRANQALWAENGPGTIALYQARKVLQPLDQPPTHHECHRIH